MATPDDNNRERSFNEAVRQFVEAQLLGKEPDIEEFVRKYPEFEHQIRQKIKEFQKVDSLFDTLVQADETDFEDTVTGQDLAGHKLGGFEIIEMIGQGGMGVVYLARDTRLDRSVAIKSMPPGLMDNATARTRFQREAKLLASLNHPNIAVIHDIIEQEALGYLVLEYVPGQTLAARITKGPLKLEEALTIALQIAGAVAAAHEHDVIHRDLKPSNIKITPEGRVKVLDFGLAKTIGGESSERKTTTTEPGRIIGTPTYMSPEQAKGEPVDYRTDIWSLGVVMYEMLTGQLPFKGGNVQAVIHSILYKEPECLRDLRRDVPVSLEQTAQKMIQKDPSNRYDSMKVLVAELESISLKSSLSKEHVVSKRARLKTAGIAIVALACMVIAAVYYLQQRAAQVSPSIAVLPFTDMSPDKDQEYFCDGMAEELINALTQIKDLRVIARTSAFSYKGRDVNIRDIGSQLNVATILEGSVRTADNRLRVTAQLVDTKSGHHLWSERYDREIGDVFAIQDEITLAIVEKLKPKLLGQEKARLAKRQPVDLEVYNLYLRGLFFWNKRDEMNFKKAIECFEQAIERDPNYAPAYAGLALSYGLLPFYSPLPSKEVVPKARELALKALEIDETLAEAHAALGFIDMRYEWNWAGADRHFKRAFEFNPRYASAHKWYSETLMYSARFDEAVKEIEQALELDPVSVAINRDLGWVYYYAGQFDRAIDASRKAIEMDPSIMYVHLHIGTAYLAKSRYEEALAEFQKEREASGGAHAWAEAYTGFTYVQMGRPDEAQKVLDNLLEGSEQRNISPFILGCLHFALGKNDEGFKLANRAYEERDQWLCWLKISWLLDDIRSDPRYTALLKKMNLEE